MIQSSMKSRIAARTDSVPFWNLACMNPKISAGVVNAGNVIRNAFAIRMSMGWPAVSSVSKSVTVAVWKTKRIKMCVRFSFHW